MEAICDYDGTAGASGVLVFKKGSVIVFSHIDASGWAMGELNGSMGWFPLQYVQKHVPPKPKPPIVQRTGPVPPPMSLRSMPSSSSSGMLPGIIQPHSSASPQFRHAESMSDLKPVKPLRPVSMLTGGTWPSAHTAPATTAITATTATTATTAPAAGAPSQTSERVTLAQRKLTALSFTDNMAAELSMRLKAAGSSSSEESAASPSTSGSPGSSKPPPRLGSASGVSGAASSSRPRVDSSALQEVRQLAAVEQPSTEQVDQGSVIKRKQNTASMLSKWLQTKRPSAEEMSSHGLLSTAGSLEMTYKPKRTKDDIFGMDLEELLDAVPDRPIPIVLDQCITYLRRCGMKTAGIFRVSPNNAELQKLKKQYKSPVSLVDFAQHVSSPHTVAGLLKLWFYSLPEPLIPFNLFDAFIQLFRNPPEKKHLLQHSKVMIQTLSTTRLDIFRFLFEFLFELQKSSDVNKMTPNNLGIVFGPNLIRPKEQSQTAMLDRTNVEIVEFLVEEFPSIIGRS
ncbi:MAG: SH3 domain-containing protein [archaeon]|nr:SH3 domain-containing protein [archaeon]